MAYDIDFVKKADLKLHIRKFLLYPSNWSDVTKQIPYPLKWRSYKFLKTNRNKIPNRKGIYCFVLKPIVDNFFETNYLFYVGKTKRTLNIRYSEYLDDQNGKGKPRPKVFEMLKLYEGNLHFYFIEISNNNHIDEIEEKLLNIFVPQINVSIPEAKISPELMYIYE